MLKIVKNPNRNRAAGHSLPEAVGFLLKKDSGPFEQKAAAFLLPEMGIESRSRAAGYKTHFSGIKTGMAEETIKAHCD